MARKTRKMKEVEKEFQRPLEELVPELISEHGLSEAAEIMGLSKATLGFWELKLGYETRRVVVKINEEVPVIMNKEQYRLWQQLLNNVTGGTSNSSQGTAGSGLEAELQAVTDKFK